MFVEPPAYQDAILHNESYLSHWARIDQERIEQMKRDEEESHQERMHRLSDAIGKLVRRELGKQPTTTRPIRKSMSVHRVGRRHKLEGGMHYVSDDDGASWEVLAW